MNGEKPSKRLEWKELEGFGKCWDEESQKLGRRKFLEWKVEEE